MKGSSGSATSPADRPKQFFALLSCGTTSNCQVSFQNREGKTGRKIHPTVETVMDMKPYLLCLRSIYSGQGQGRKEDKDDVGRGQSFNRSKQLQKLVNWWPQTVE